MITVLVILIFQYNILLFYPQQQNNIVGFESATQPKLSVSSLPEDCDQSPKTTPPSNPTNFEHISYYPTSNPDPTNHQQ
jgi:hypothetical protein